MTHEEVVRRVLIALANSNMIRPSPSWPPFTNLAGVSAGDLAEAANLVAEHARECAAAALASNNLLRWVAQAKRVIIDNRPFKLDGHDTCWADTRPMDLDRMDPEWKDDVEDCSEFVPEPEDL